MSSPLVRPTLTKFAERGVRDGSSPTEAFATDGSAATRLFFVKWSERFLAASAILGYADIGYTGITPDGLRRLTPLIHPDTTVFPQLWYASAITKVEGHKFTGNRIGSDTSIANTFKWAKIEVQYEQLGYLVIDDTATIVPGTADAFSWPGDEYRRWVSFGEPRTSTDYVTLPGNILKYARSAGTAVPHNRPIPFNVGISLPIMELPVTWHKVPYDIFNPNLSSAISNPWPTRIWGDASTLPYLGSVNKTTFLNRPPGTLLFSNIRPIPRKSAFLRPEYDIEFTFAFDPHGWNYKAYISVGAATEWISVVKESSPGAVTYYAPGSVPDGMSMYNEREFRDLFKVF